MQIHSPTQSWHSQDCIRTNPVEFSPASPVKILQGEARQGANITNKFYLKIVSQATMSSKSEDYQN
jgi:hypothetical protein